MSYQYRNHPNEEQLGLSHCYICGEPLGEKLSPDHIIPNHLFEVGDPNRPQLHVHAGCNNGKSLDDQWFAKHLQLVTAYNPLSHSRFLAFLEKALSEAPDAYLIGKRPRNLILAKKLFDNSAWGLEIVHQGTEYAQMRLSEANKQRFQTYVENMCRGIFIRNVPSALPGKPELFIRQYEALKIQGKYKAFMDLVRGIVGKGDLFGQSWDDRILYLGSRTAENPNKGYVFLDFYGQLGILAFFNETVSPMSQVELELI